jgi:uncharacterized damage-inducible protein DinB
VSAPLFQRLFAHLVWADARTLDALRAAAGAPPRALELMAHVLGAERNWFARIRSRAPDAPIWPAPTVDDCTALMRRAHPEWIAYIAALTDAELARVVHYKNSAGAEFDSRVDDILLHVCMHGVNHRGQANAILRSAGFEPAAGDYIAFARGAPAATRQP